MGAEENALPPLMQLAEDGTKKPSPQRIEATHRFVKDKNVWIAKQGMRHTQPLLHAL